jgi:hypothetical protein
MPPPKQRGAALNHCGHNTSPTTKRSRAPCLTVLEASRGVRIPFPGLQVSGAIQSSFFPFLAPLTAGPRAARPPFLPAGRGYILAFRPRRSGTTSSWLDTNAEARLKKTR